MKRLQVLTLKLPAADGRLEDFPVREPNVFEKPIATGHEIYLQVVSRCMTDVKNVGTVAKHELKAPMVADNFEMRALSPVLRQRRFIALNSRGIRQLDRLNCIYAV